MLNSLKISNKENIYKKFIDEKNYGLTEVQIIFLTNKISILHKHCLINKKDYHNKRGLILFVSKRRKLLNYLRKNNIERYNDITSFLKLRKKK